MTNEIIMAIVLVTSTTNWTTYHSTYTPRTGKGLYTLEIRSWQEYQIGTIDQRRELEIIYAGKEDVKVGQRFMLESKTIVPDPPLVRVVTRSESDWTGSMTNLPSPYMIEIGPGLTITNFPVWRRGVVTNELLRGVWP